MTDSFLFYWAIRDGLSIKSSHVGYKFRSDPLESCTCTEGTFYFLLNSQSNQHCWNFIVGHNSAMMLGTGVPLPRTAEHLRPLPGRQWRQTISNLLISPCFSVNLEKVFTLSMFSFQDLRRWWCSRIYHKDRLVRQRYSPLTMYGAVPYVYHMKAELFPTGFPVKNPISLQMREW